MDKQKFHSMVGAAFIAAVMAILSQFTIPVGAVSMTLQTFVCALAGGLLGSRWGGGFYFGLAAARAFGDSRAYHGKSRTGNIFESCRRILYRIYHYGRPQRFPSCRQRLFCPPVFIGTCRSVDLLRLRDNLVYGILFFGARKGNALMDGTYHDRISLCYF